MVVTNIFARGPVSIADWIFIGIAASFVITVAGLVARSAKNAITDVVTEEIGKVVRHTLEIDKKVTPNGGNSATVGDTVVRLERGQEAVLERLDELQDSHELLASRVGGIGTSLEEHQERDDERFSRLDSAEEKANVLHTELLEGLEAVRESVDRRHRPVKKAAAPVKKAPGKRPRR